MYRALMMVVLIAAVGHGVWAERARRRAIYWQGIAVREDLDAREEAVRLRLANDALEATLRRTKERQRGLESQVWRYKCLSGEERCCLTPYTTRSSSTSWRRKDGPRREISRVGPNDTSR